MTKFRPEKTHGLSQDEVMEGLSEAYYKEHPFVHFDFYKPAQEFAFELFVDHNSSKSWHLRIIDNLISDLRKLVDNDETLKDKVVFYKIRKSFRDSEGKATMRITMRNKKKLEKQFFYNNENKDPKVAKELIEEHPDLEGTHTHTYMYPETAPVQVNELFQFI